jgi:hypothetical protein
MMKMSWHCRGKRERKNWCGSGIKNSNDWRATRRAGQHDDELDLELRIMYVLMRKYGKFSKGREKPGEMYLRAQESA